MRRFRMGCVRVERQNPYLALRDFFFLLEDSCLIVGRFDSEAETPVFWSSYVNRQLIGKAPDARKD